MTHHYPNCGKPHPNWDGLHPNWGKNLSSYLEGDLEGDINSIFFTYSYKHFIIHAFVYKVQRPSSSFTSIPLCMHRATARVCWIAECSSNDALPRTTGVTDDTARVRKGPKCNQPRAKGAASAHRGSKGAFKSKRAPSKRGARRARVAPKDVGARRVCAFDP